MAKKKNDKEEIKTKADLVRAKAAKKAEKLEAKDQKRRDKLIKAGFDPNDPALDEETGIGGKIAIFFATIIVIIIWLGILGIIIKWDVGGFGSTVMYPVLKDVPYVNMILPEVAEEPEEDENAGFDTVAQAVTYARGLESQLASANDEITKLKKEIDSLNAQVSKLKAYEDNVLKFEEEKLSFDKEVVFSDQAPDITEYQKYYEAISPENAEEIYRQTLEQAKTDKELQEYVATYSAMKPKAAAAVFDDMTDNLSLVARILEAMDIDSRANIMNNLSKDTAAKLTAIMNPD